VAELIRVDEPSDLRLADYFQLRDADLRKSLEAEHGLFIAEGEKVIRRAYQAGYEIRSLLMSPKWLQGLADVLSADPAPCFVVSAKVIEQLTGFHVHRGALASFARRAVPGLVEILHSARRVIVVEDIVDPTNLGAIFRSAAALGVDAIVLSPRCADPLYRRSVRVAMGAVFVQPYTRVTDWYGALDRIRDCGFQVLALTPAADAMPIEQALVGCGERVALVLGSEGHGLSPRWLASADVRVTIPMTRGVDSLNVAACAAICAYLLAKA
jgi:tRNA G18 (ribose-2'-O)-methylase SpoU